MAKNVKRRDFITSGLVAQNRRANFDYLIEEKFVAGLELTGTEVKSMRLGHANINDAYGIIKGDELFISNMYIAEYTSRGYESHVEKRERKLLLTRREINNIINSLSRKGTTLIAIRLYFNDKGRAKLEIGLGTGKKLYDKRADMAKKSANREIDRTMKNVNRD